MSDQTLSEMVSNELFDTLAAVAVRAIASHPCLTLMTFSGHITHGSSDEGMSYLCLTEDNEWLKLHISDGIEGAQASVDTVHICINDHTLTITPERVVLMHDCVMIYTKHDINEIGTGYGTVSIIDNQPLIEEIASTITGVTCELTFTNNSANPNELFTMTSSDTGHMFTIDEQARASVMFAIYVVHKRKKLTDVVISDDSQSQ